MSGADAAPVTLRLRITGKVQGVWYRSWTIETARGLGLSVWVRNCADGSVEALVHGPDEAVQRMVAACHEGPPAARVAAVATAPATPVAADLAGGFSQWPST